MIDSLIQVVTGGHYDVDVVIQDPAKQVIYKEVKKQVDTQRNLVNYVLN